VLDEELAVPCNLQSAIAGFNSPTRYMLAGGYFGKRC